MTLWLQQQHYCMWTMAFNNSSINVIAHAKLRFKMTKKTTLNVVWQFLSPQTTLLLWMLSFLWILMFFTVSIHEYIWIDAVIGVRTMLPHVGKFTVSNCIQCSYKRIHTTTMITTLLPWCGHGPQQVHYKRTLKVKMTQKPLNVVREYCSFVYQLCVYLMFISQYRGDDLFSDWYILGPQTSKVLVQ